MDPPQVAKRRTPEQISEIMRRVKATDTTPEKVYRSALRAAGLRFRKHAAELPGNPDIALASHKLAVFIDGDYWHGNQWRRRGLLRLEDQFRRTKSRGYWLRKIRGNADRDCRATAELADMGWKALRFWESDVRGRLDECVRLTVEAAERGRATSGDKARAVLARRSAATFFVRRGAMRDGLEREGWTVVFSCHSRGQDCGRGARCLLRSARSLRAEDVPAAALAAASFVRADAFGEWRRLLREMRARRPPMVLVERDAGFVVRRRPEDLRVELRALNDLGYAVDAFMARAGGQARLYVIGRLDVAAAPSRLDSEGAADRPRVLSAFIRGRLDLRWMVRRLPRPPDFGAGDPGLASAAAWIARHYLNPCVEESIRGQPVRKR